MADQNYVEIKIKADDTAKPDLTDLRAKLDELGAKVESAKVDVDDKDATAKLLALNAKLAALDKRAANPRITVAGAARVEADIAAIDASLKHLDEDAKKADNSSAGLKSRLLALGGAAGSVAGVGDAMTAASGDANMFQKVMAGAGLATGLLEPVVAGATVAIGGLASGLVAAGAGLGAFGLVAKSNLSVATTAANQVQAAQIAYNAQIANGVKQSKAYQTEQIAINKAYAQMSPAQIALSKQIGNVQNAWQSFVQSNTAGVSKILTQGIGLMPKVFQSMQVFMAPTEKALSGLISQLGKGLNSQGFKSFIDMLASNAGPAITKLGQSIGHIAVGLGGIIRAFMPMAQTMLSGLDKITKKFADWGSTLTSHSGFQSLMSQFKSETPLAMKTLENLATAIVNIGKAMAGLSTGSNSKTLLQMLQPLSGILASLSKNTDLDRIALYLLAGVDAGKKLKGAFDGVKGGLEGLDKGINLIGKLGGAAVDASRGAKLAAGATKIWSGIQAAFNIVMDANPIMLIVIAIGLLVGAFILLWTHFKGFRDFWKDAWRDIKNWTVDAWHFIEQAFHAIVKAITTAWDDVKHAFLTVWHWILSFIDLEVTGVKNILHWFSQLGSLFHGWWNDAVNAVTSVVGGLLRFVSGIPGSILRSLGNLGSLLWNAGKDLVQGLINGVTSMFGAVASTAGHLVSSLGGSVLHLLGIGSPSKVAHWWGEMVAQGLANGISSNTHLPANAAARMAGAVTGGLGRPGAGIAGAGAGGGQIVLQFAPSGGTGLDALFWTWLRQGVRVKGGTGSNSVQLALGQSR
jgi:hypothetical protein